MVQRYFTRVPSIGTITIENNDVPDYCYGLFDWECHIDGQVRYGTAFTPDEASAEVKSLIAGKKKATCTIRETVTYAKSEMAACRSYALSTPNFFKEWFKKPQKAPQLAEKTKEKVELASEIDNMSDDYYGFSSGKYLYLAFSEGLDIFHVRVDWEYLAKGIWKVNVDADMIPERILIVTDGGVRGIKVMSFSLWDFVNELNISMDIDLIDRLSFVHSKLPTLPGVETVSKEEFVKAYKAANTVSYSTI